MITKNKCPNILITGTPCVGKSHLAKKLAEKLNYKFQDVSKIVKDHNFIESYDDELECPIMDEDKLLDYLEPIMQEGGNIVEYHGCEFFPERWFHLVYVVRCKTDILHERLTQRNYNSKKLQSNLQCEIFQIILEEAMDSYKPEIVFQIYGETEDQLNANIEIICKSVNELKK